jgi:hypothetical protein
VKFYEEFYGIKYADAAKRDNVRVSWNARKVSSETPMSQLPSFSIWVTVIKKIR